MIPTNDPGRALQGQRVEIDSAIRRVLDSGRLILGPENEALSAELAEYLGVKYCTLVGNGTDALEIALLAAGVQSGEQVLTVANAGGYATTAIRKIGGQPVYVEVDPSSLQMSVAVDGVGLRHVLASLPERPAAIIVTHLFGQAAPIREIMGIVRGTEIVVIEDCAQSLGASINGKKLGSFGHVSTTSFYPTKNLGALGDGGAIFSSSELIDERARSLRQYGWKLRYQSDLSRGRNSRLDEIQAAVLRLKLQSLDSLNSRRREIHERYTGTKPSTGSFRHVVGEDFVAHLSTMIFSNRRSARDHFTRNGIATDIHYPIPDHLQKAFRQETSPSLPVTEELAKNILTIPLFPELMDWEIQRVEAALATLEIEG